jgi:hypothetical protein
MHGPQAELKSAMFALATKVQGTAGSANANCEAVQQLKSAIVAGEKRQGHLQKQFADMK